ncbi:hypothetical protein QR680_009654 [Steinernema hermaphroditum]|uniref:Solute carrier family 35 member F5 n=1 Tax=Steinernema hermaphroditum TaxID=289476 RepID=A0AA39INL4_9BILA|nr:hypothetical protein QR680_009654 [Steinernema hermaphroditum]
MIGGSSSGLHQSSRHLFGLLLLVVVNVLWVASAELTRVIFVDDSFRRPFFVTYVKTCLLVVYFLRFWICGPSQTVVTETQLNGAKYSLLQDSEDEYEPEALTSPEFEPVTTVVSDAEALQEDPSSPSREKRFRKVRFSLMREVRRLPSAIADEARKARLPYRPPTVECSLKFSPMTKCTIALAPLWLVCSMTYQTALMFTTVSAVNLLSASSSLLVLVLAAFFGRRPSDRFTCRKLFLVLLNLVGVAVVSGFSNSGAGAFLALGSAITYAVYLTSYQAVCDKFGAIDMNLLFGVIGLASILAGTPLLYVLHISGIEKLTPWPSGDEWSVLLASALFGTVISDYLCLYATALTGPLTASLSFTLSIPLSILADVLFRHRPPTSLQMLAAVPIVFSFAGAALVGRSVASDQSGHATKTSDMEMRERADFERENLMRAVYANDVEDDDGDLLFAKNQFVVGDSGVDLDPISLDRKVKPSAGLAAGFDRFVPAKGKGKRRREFPGCSAPATLFPPDGIAPPLPNTGASARADGQQRRRVVFEPLRHPRRLRIPRLAIHAF